MMVNYETSHCGKLCQWRFEHKRKYFGRITLHASRHYHTIIGIQRIRQHRIKIALLMSWATIFCAPLQLLGNDLCELGNVFLRVPLLQEKQNKGKQKHEDIQLFTRVQNLGLEE